MQDVFIPSGVSSDLNNSAHLSIYLTRFPFCNHVSDETGSKKEQHREIKAWVDTGRAQAAAPPASYFSWSRI